MKKLLSLILSCTTFFASSQIVIDDSDLPSGGDTIRVSQTLSISNFSPDSTGADYQWDFSGLQAISQAVDTLINISEVNFVYSAVFNNFLNDQNADFARKNPFRTDSMMGISIEDRLDFYELTSNKYTMLGFGASINGIPTPIKYDDPELIYNLPLGFMDMEEDSFAYSISIPNIGYYGQNGHKSYEVDGWGNITTPYGTFDCLRTHITINSTDSIAWDTLPGFTIPRPTQHVYQWLVEEYPIPLLSVETSELLGQTSITNITYIDSIQENLIGIQETRLEGINVYQNTNLNDVNIIFNSNHFGNTALIQIFGTNGALIREERIEVNNLHEMNISTLNQGAYILNIVIENKSFQKTIVKL